MALPAPAGVGVTKISVPFGPEMPLIAPCGTLVFCRARMADVTSSQATLCCALSNENFLRPVRDLYI